MQLTQFQKALYTFGLTFTKLYNEHRDVVEYVQNNSDLLLGVATIPYDQLTAVEEVILCDNPSQTAKSIAKQWLTSYLRPKE